MSIRDKIVNAKVSHEVSESFSDVEIKKIKLLSHISSQIELCRVEKKMTQIEFANYMGVTQGMVSKWESGNYNFTVESLTDISEKLGVEFDVIFKKDYFSFESSKAVQFSRLRKKKKTKISIDNYRFLEEGIA